MATIYSEAYTTSSGNSSFRICCNYTEKTNTTTGVKTITYYYYLEVTKGDFTGTQGYVSWDSTSFEINGIGKYRQSATKTLIVQPNSSNNTIPAATGGYLNNTSRRKTVGPVSISSITTYTITYNTNGGTNAPDSQIKIHGTSLILSEVKPSKTSTSETYTITLNGNGGTVTPNLKTVTNNLSYSFSKWTTNPDGTGTVYQPGGTYTNNANITLYAQYNVTTQANEVVLSTSAQKQNDEVDSFTISFDVDGGSNYINQINGNKIAVYKFSSWNSEPDGTGIFYNNTSGYQFLSDITLYAIWEIETYIENNYLSGLTLNPGTKTGYSFIGWSELPPTAINRPVINTDTYTTNEDVILYAVWQPNTYTLTLNANSGYFNQQGISTKTIPIVFGETYINAFKPENLPTRENQKLNGWIDSIPTGQLITSSTQVTRAENHTIYANWISGFYVVPYIYYEGQWIEIGGDNKSSIIVVDTTNNGDIEISTE